MGVGKLIGGALRPGASLKHESHRIVAVDVLRAIACTTPIASALIYASCGRDNLPELAAAVKDIVIAVFADRGWEIAAHRAIPAAARLDRFVAQVCWEYLGAPCKRCMGHGFVGLKYEALRHRLDECPKCGGAGFVRTAKGLRQICSSCRGKRLVEVSEAVKAGKLSMCIACWGSGSVPASTRRRARTLGCDHMHVYRFWQERFRIVLAALRDHERQGLVAVQEALT